MRPLLIGVSARIYMPGTPGINVSGIWTKNLHYLEQSVAHWVLSGHAMAVMIPAVTKGSIVTRSDLDLDDYANTLDGLVLQGGNDVAPETYGETPLHPDWAGDRVRDRYEIELIDAFVRRRQAGVRHLPRPAIAQRDRSAARCCQDIATQRPASRAHRDGSAFERHFHGIELVQASRLAQLYPGVPRPQSTRIHHQAIKDLAPGFAVEACCPDDGMIEAVRRAGRFATWPRVQWHPEFHIRGDPDEASTTRRCCATS